MAEYQYPNARDIMQMAFNVGGMKTTLGNLGHQKAYQALLQAENEIRKVARIAELREETDR